MITGICNIYINTQIKLDIFQESFPEVFSLSDNWLIYIRWKFRSEAISFINEKFKNTPDNFEIFQNLYDSDWIKSTSKMLEKANHSYVFLYWEDHFLVNRVEKIKSIVEEMEKENIDYLQYSMFNIWIPIYNIEELYPDDYENVFALSITEKNKLSLFERFFPFYPFSIDCICTKDLLQKMLQTNNYKWILIWGKIQFGLNYLLMPLSYISKALKFKAWIRTFCSLAALVSMMNKIFVKIWYKFILFPKATPFNLEKHLLDFELYPIKVWFVKEELFANWDDDNWLSNSALIKRWLYPKSFTFKKYEKIDWSKHKTYSLKKGQIKYGVYYSPFRRADIPVKIVKVISGELKITWNNEEFILKSWEEIWFFSNKKHQLTAVEDTTYSYSVYNVDSQRVSYFKMI